MLKDTDIQRLKPVPKKRISVITSSGKKYASKWTEIDEIYEDYESIHEWEEDIIQDISDSLEKGDSIQSIALLDYKCGDGFYVTEHALKRVKERTGWNRRAALRMIKKAYENGEKDLSEDHYLYEWITKKTAQERFDFANLILYGNYLFIFRKKTLITVFQVPSKEKITHIKKGNTSYKKSKEELRYV